MSKVVIVGDLPNSVKDMIVVNMESEMVKKIMKECVLIDHKNISWNSTNRNTWFACINTTTNKGYYFPLVKSKNRENNYDRVKRGMAYFSKQGYGVFKLQ